MFRRLTQATAALLVLLGSASAQSTISYSFSGTITSNVPGSALWGSVPVGAPYTITFRYRDIPPLFSNPGEAFYGGSAESVTMTVGGITSTVLTGGQVIVRNDDDVANLGTLCEDGWQWFAEDNATEYDQASVILQERVPTSGPCPSIVPSLDLPLSVDPTLFSTTFFRLRTLELTEMFGTVDSVVSISQAADDCTDAIPLPSGFGVTPFDATGATTDGADGAGFTDYGTFGDEQNYNDIWFTYIPTVSGCTYISTLGLVDYDTRLTVYQGTGCPDNPMNIIAAADDEVLPVTAPFEAGLDVNLIAGMTYTIRVGTFDAATLPGRGSLLIAAGPGADLNSGGANPGAPGCVPPGNDSCMDAELIVGTGLFSFDTIDATTDGAFDLLCGCGGGLNPNFNPPEFENDVWFAWMAPADGLYTVSTIGLANGADTMLAVQAGCGLASLACNDDLSFGMLESELRFRAEMGQPYRIRIGTNGQAPGTIGQFSIQPGAILPAVIETTSFEGKNYALLEPSNVTDAALAATDLGGSLVTINGQAEQDHLTSTFLASAFEFWIGLSDRETEGSFQWLDGSPLTFTDWNGIEPNDFEIGEDFVLCTAFSFGSGSWNDELGCLLRSGVVEIDDEFVEMCFGDGGDQQGCADCPCNNNAPVGTVGGCLNSAGTSARLIPGGSSSLMASDLCFEMSGGTPGSFAILGSGMQLAPQNPANPCFAANPGSGIASPALSGLLCRNGSVLRHGTRAIDASGFVGPMGPAPDGTWGYCSGNFFNSAFSVGEVRFFQAFYRDEKNGSCTNELNTTQAVGVTFGL